MSLDLYLSANKNGTKTLVHWNRAYAIREWITSEIGVPMNGCETISIGRLTLHELLNNCNQIIEDRSRASALIPINTNDFDPNQKYDDDYFEQIYDTKEKLDHLFKRWNGRKPLYYYEWY